jgi:hypothetical protein
MEWQKLSNYREEVVGVGGEPWRLRELQLFDEEPDEKELR